MCWRADAALAPAELNQLSFGPRSQVLAETLLGRFTSYLRQMETQDTFGNKIPAMSDTILPTLFRSKSSLPVFDSWRASSVRDGETWTQMKVSFPKHAFQHESVLKVKGYSSNRVKVPQAQGSTKEEGIPSSEFDKLDVLQPKTKMQQRTNTKSNYSMVDWHKTGVYSERTLTMS